MAKPDKTAEKTAKNKSAVPAVEKALDVLELLADAPHGMTMNELVEVQNRTMGEIYRVVIYLAERGFLRQDPASSRYSLTLKLFELSHRHEPTDRMIQAAVPVLERFATTMNQSCHLSVLSNDFVLVLASAQSPMPAGYAVRTGGLFPIAHSSSGHVILAFSPPNVQDRYLAKFREREKPDLERRLASIRKTGFENAPSTMVSGVHDLCAPVFDSRGVVGAITSGYLSRVGETATVEMASNGVRDAALELSAALGCRLADQGKSGKSSR